MDTSKLKQIGHWIDLAKYYVDPNGIVWTWHASSRGLTNSGNEVDFRARFATMYRGELTA